MPEKPVEHAGARLRASRALEHIHDRVRRPHRMERQDLAAALGAGVGHALERGELHVAEAACAGAKSRPTSPTKRASLASCSNCATSSSVQRPSAAHQGSGPGPCARSRKGRTMPPRERIRPASRSPTRAPMPRCAPGRPPVAQGVFREVQMAMQVEQAQGRVAFRHVSFGSAFRCRMRRPFFCAFPIVGALPVAGAHVTLLGQGAPAFRLGVPFVFRLCHAHSPPMPASVARRRRRRSSDP